MTKQGRSNVQFGHSPVRLVGEMVSEMSLASRRHTRVVINDSIHHQVIWPIGAMGRVHEAGS